MTAPGREALGLRGLTVDRGRRTVVQDVSVECRPAR